MSHGTINRSRSWWLDLLLRGPGELRSVTWRVLVTALIATGTVCVLGSGVIHLYLWGKQYGYRSVPTIGPLFLAQGIVTILIGLLVIVTRRVAAVLAGAGIMIASVGALIIAIEVGLFGFKDSWLAPYAKTSLYEEIVGAMLLLVAAGVLAWPARSGPSGIRR